MNRRHVFRRQAFTGLTGAAMLPLELFSDQIRSEKALAMLKGLNDMLRA